MELETEFKYIRYIYAALVCAFIACVLWSVGVFSSEVQYTVAVKYSNGNQDTVRFVGRSSFFFENGCINTAHPVKQHVCGVNTYQILEERASNE